jgi:hypothetical protein
MRVDLQKDVWYVKKSGETVKLRRREGWEEGEQGPYQDQEGYYYSETGGCMFWSNEQERFFTSHGPSDDLLCSVSDRRQFRFSSADVIDEIADSLTNGMSEIARMIGEYAASEKGEVDQDILKGLNDLFGQAGVLCKAATDASAKWRQRS